MKKYNVTTESIKHHDVVLWRIEHAVTKEKGGWIQRESNLSQSGTAWVADEAKVYGEAYVYEEAHISGKAEVFGAAKVGGNAKVYGEANVFDQAVVLDYVQVYDQAKVYGDAVVEGVIDCFGEEHRTKSVYTWADINFIDSIKLSTGVGGAKEELLFGNNKHQIVVEVNIVARNAAKENIVVSPQEVFHHIQFVDYKNKPVGQLLKVSDKAGPYVFPEGRRTDRNANTSVGIFYISAKEALGFFELCTSCIVDQKVNAQNQVDERQVEYTTARVGGNQLFDAIHLNIPLERIFSKQDIGVHAADAIKNPNAYNSLLYKFYFRFESNTNSLLKNANVEEDKWFFYKQNGNYKSFATSTDSLVKEDRAALYTAVFEITNKWTIEITATNHEEVGVCMWIYRVWHGALWTYKTWEKPMLFSLFDQYGNEAKIAVKMDNEVRLEYEVV